ncbi:MAG: hypothetical protein HYR73_07510 [Candidatus Eisenbacteria bacterium]|nr:hypothetical protein [Candidatus Eisenbacteria bacterium]
MQDRTPRLVVTTAALFLAATLCPSLLRAGAAADSTRAHGLPQLDRKTILLSGGRDAPMLFAVKDALTLRMLDVEGRAISSKLNYDLGRTGRF